MLINDMNGGSGGRRRRRRRRLSMRMRYPLGGRIRFQLPFLGRDGWTFAPLTLIVLFAIC